MIAYLQGKVLRREEQFVVIDVAGVGYKVHSPTPLIMALSIGDDISMHIYSHIREDQFTLYGFADATEIFLFEKLLGVSGIGPKGALSMLSVHSAASIANAVENNNPLVLSSTPGIGKKTAEKMIIELKGKLLQFRGSEDDDALFEVRLALESLGYSPKEIQSAVKGIDTENKTTSMLIREVLSALQ